MKESAIEVRVNAALRSSVLLGWVDRATTVVSRSAGQSRVMAPARAWHAQWLALSPAERRLNTARLLCSAAVAAVVAMTLSPDTPPGWLWLVLPGIALSIGLLCLRSRA